MKLISWNVNGIRACAKKGFLKWLKRASPDVLCIQETKAWPEQLDETLVQPAGYRGVWATAKKKGYSGVATFVKESLTETKSDVGIGEPKFDDEGRVVVHHLDGTVVINAYFPNVGRSLDRLPFRLEFNDTLLRYCDRLRKNGKSVVVCGDYNVAHREIDLKNPKTNQKNAGFTPEEREWMTKFLDAGYVDTFRHFHPDKKDQYTWWSQMRPDIRTKNIGWRLDYFCTDEDFMPRVTKAAIHPRVMGSDHCPVSLEVDA